MVRAPRPMRHTHTSHEPMLSVWSTCEPHDGRLCTLANRSCKLAHLHTCILSHLHTCTLAHLHTLAHTCRPCVGAVKYSFMSPPQVSFDLRVCGFPLMSLPGVEAILNAQVGTLLRKGKMMHVTQPIFVPGSIRPPRGALPLPATCLRAWPDNVSSPFCWRHLFHFYGFAWSRSW
jgi:hypothetical protein